MNLIFEEIVLDPFWQIIIGTILAFAVTYRAVPIIIILCEEVELFEESNDRSSHTVPVPKFGGIGIFAGTFIGYFMFNLGDEGVLMHKVFVGVLLLFFLGIKDDIYVLSALKKVITQILASAIVVIGSDLRITHFFGIMGIDVLPYFTSVLFTIFVFIALINSFNLIDGIDGLAAGIGMISCAFLGWWFISNEFWSLACLALCTAASLAAFLRYNLSKRQRIFMGDTGSLIVGYIIAVLTIKFIHFNVNHQFAPNSIFVSSPLIVVALLSVPIFDTLRVFSIRISQKRSPFKPDRLHMHHLIVDNGFTHVQTSVAFYVFTLIFTFISYLLRLHISNYGMIAVIVTAFVCYAILGHQLEIRKKVLKINHAQLKRKILKDSLDTKNALKKITSTAIGQN